MLESLVHAYIANIFLATICPVGSYRENTETEGDKNKKNKTALIG